MCWQLGVGTADGVIARRSESTVCVEGLAKFLSEINLTSKWDTFDIHFKLYGIRLPFLYMCIQKLLCNL